MIKRERFLHDVGRFILTIFLSMQRNFVLLALLASASFLQAPLANAKSKIPEIPKEITTVMQKAKPFQRANDALGETCMPLPKPKWKHELKNDKIHKKMVKYTKRWNKLAAGCKGAIAAGCVYDATKGVKVPVVIDKPLEYATKAAKCIINVNDEVLEAKMAAANAIKEYGEQVGKEVGESGKKAANECKKAGADIQKCVDAINVAQEEILKAPTKQPKKEVKNKVKEAKKETKKVVKKAGKEIKKVFKKKKKKKK